MPQQPRKRRLRSCWSPSPAREALGDPDRRRALAVSPLRIEQRRYFILMAFATMCAVDGTEMPEITVVLGLALKVLTDRLGHATSGPFSNHQAGNERGKTVTKLSMLFVALLLAACGTETGIGNKTGGASSSLIGIGPAPVSLGTAGHFAILSKSGITDVYASAIIGDVGTSPITGAALLLTCGEVTGKIFTVDAAGPLPCAVDDATSLTAAVGDMENAYNDASGRLSPNFTELGAGEIGGLTLAPGLYKWGTGLLISTDVTLSGGPDDVWIFQVAGTLNQANATRVTLAGGALPKNIFWQVAGAVTIGTTAHFEGVVLAKTMVAANTGASVNGRLLAQTAVTLQMNTVTEPAPSGTPIIGGDKD